jgi:hypothetical protein
MSGPSPKSERESPVTIACERDDGKAAMNDFVLQRGADG